MNILVCSSTECSLHNPQGKSLLNSFQVLFHTIISLCYDKDTTLPISLETTKQILKNFSWQMLEIIRFRFNPYLNSSLLPAMTGMKYWCPWFISIWPRLLKHWEEASNICLSFQFGSLSCLRCHTSLTESLYLRWGKHFDTMEPSS